MRMDTSSPNVESTAGLLTLFQTTFPLARREGGSRIPSMSSNSCELVYKMAGDFRVDVLYHVNIANVQPCLSLPHY